MRLRTIKLSLDNKTSIAKAIDDLRSVKIQIEDASREIVEELTEKTETWMNDEYNGTADLPLDADYSVDKEINGNKGKVFSKGTSVIYMEFGTGDIGQENDYHPKRYTFGLKDYNTGNTIREDGAGGHYWMYKGNYTRGIPAGVQVYSAAYKLNREKSKISKQIVRDALRKH